MKIVIVRSRRKTLSLSVNRKAQAVVRAPLCVKDEEINRFVEKHRDWLEARLARMEKAQLQLADGARLSLFGKEYTVARGRVAIKNGTLFLPEENREATLVRLLKPFTQNELSGRTASFADAYGFRYAGVRISSARGRWGSCSKKGGISYSFRTALLPSELVNYIVVHELCHTLFFNHSAQFWREVEQVLPDYKLLRKRLKGCSDIMNLL